MLRLFRLLRRLVSGCFLRSKRCPQFLFEAFRFRLNKVVVILQGRCGATVSKQSSHIFQFHPMLEQVSSKRMPEHVRMWLDRFARSFAWLFSVSKGNERSRPLN